MAILVTGGAGFIGAAVVRRLLEEGERVVVLDSFEPLLYGRAEKEASLAWAREAGEFALVEGDIRDRRAVEAALSAAPVEGVIHLAAVAGVRSSLACPDVYADINVTGTIRVVEAARAAGVRRFALASSSSVYAGNVKTPFAEEDPIISQASPYGASKFAMEAVVSNLQALYGLDLCCLRFFTVYGPRQRPDMAFHRFMRCVAAGEALPMYGDGSSGRDYTYIDDIVSGVLASYRGVRGYRVYNLGGDEVHRLTEVLELLGEVTGRAVRVNRLPEQPGDVFITSADVTRARAELGYAPQVGLREGLARMWAWYSTR